MQALTFAFESGVLIYSSYIGGLNVDDKTQAGRRET